MYLRSDCEIRFHHRTSQSRLYGVPPSSAARGRVLPMARASLPKGGAGSHGLKNPNRMISRLPSLWDDEVCIAFGSGVHVCVTSWAYISISVIVVKSNMYAGEKPIWKTHVVTQVNNERLTLSKQELLILCGNPSRAGRECTASVLFWEESQWISLS